MVTRPVARRRKSAQTKSESVNPSRKRRRGAATFSRKMVISSDMPAPAIRLKITEVSRVSPKLNQYDLSGYPHNGQEDRVKGLVTVRHPFPKLEINGDGSQSEPIASDELFEISNQGREPYAGVIEPSSSDSESDGIKIGEYEEHEFYGLGASESHLEIFSHLRRRLKQLVVDGLSLPKEKAGCLQSPDREQTSAEAMKRLDLLSDTWTNYSVDDKLGKSSCTVDEQPRQSELLRLIDEELLVDMNAKTSSDVLGRKYWNPGSNDDLVGSNEESQSQDWNQLERGDFLGEQLRARGTRLPRHTQVSAEVSDPIHAKLPCSPTACTCAHLSTWKHCRESMSSHATPHPTTKVRPCSNGRHPPSSPSDSVVNLNDTSQKCFPAISVIAADYSDDCNSTTIGQQAKTLPTHSQKLLEPWKNFQDHQILPTAAAGLFKNFSEPQEDHFALLISRKPNELMLSTLEQPPTHRAKPERESYDYRTWDTMPATDCQDIAFTGSDDCKLTDEAERSEFPALHGLDFGTLEYRADGETESFHSGSSDPPFSRDHFEGLPSRLPSPPEFSDFDWLSETAGDHRRYFNSADTPYKLKDSCLSDDY